MVSDSDCLKCHRVPEAAILLPGDRAFEHGPLLARGIRCVACHGSVTQGDGFVPRSRCVVCHNFPIDNELLADHERLHELHVTQHKVECTDCHNEISHGYESDRRAAAQVPGRMAPRRARIDCLSCHPNRHAATVTMAEGTASGLAGESQPVVGAMFAARVECLACHRGSIDGKFGSTRVGDPTACVTCHGVFGTRELARWRSVIEPKIASAEAAVRGSTQPEPVRARARTMVEVVRRGGYVHNADLAVTLLDAATSLARTGRLPRGMAPGAHAAVSGVDAGLRGDTTAPGERP